MNTYKITNITNLAGKRDFKFNSELEIEYVDGISKKTIKVKPSESIYLTVQALPLSVHRLRVKNLITVSEVSAVELAKTMSSTKPKGNKIEVEVSEEDTEKRSGKTLHGKKKVGKKEENADIEVDA